MEDNKISDINNLVSSDMGYANSIVYNMDCIEGMLNYGDNHFDLAIVDPPYGIGEASGQEESRNKSKGRAQTKVKYTIKDWDKEPPSIEYFKELTRVSKNQIIFGANHFIENIPNCNSSCWLIWDKDNTGDFADGELAWTSLKSAVRIFKWRWNGMLQQNMKNKEIRIHPTQKPVALYDWIMQNYAKEGDSILDTHLGSGSSRISANKAGLDFTGFELDSDYFNDSEKRFKQFISQTRLF